jgi:DNA-binding cell septation regulator SpoVG
MFTLPKSHHECKPAASFSVSNWRPLQKNTLRAFWSITAPSGLTTHGCTLQEKADNRWLSMPARQYEKNGTTTWAPVVEFASKESRDKFQSAALAAIDACVAEEEL